MHFGGVRAGHLALPRHRCRVITVIGVIGIGVPAAAWLIIGVVLAAAAIIPVLFGVRWLAKGTAARRTVQR
jgi:hypothetical protein